jgi:hypothetical protein
MKEITYKGNIYQLDIDYWKGELLNDSIEFQYDQLMYCFEIGDYQTFENRVNNMLKWGGIKQINKTL